MKPKVFVSLLIVLVFISISQLFSGDIQFLWSKSLDSGVVYDLEFMPDNNYFIMGTTYSTQIRETATGNIIKSYPFYLGQIEFTPDSTKMITQHEYNIQLRNISDLSIIKQYTLPWGTDTTDLNYELSSIGWDHLVVDPVRPLIYAVRHRAGYVSSNKYVDIRRIMIYNYETMQEVGELTLPDDINSHIKYIAISNDGKYLASINEAESHIMVWDLNTRQKIRNFKLCEGDPNATWGEPGQIQFSSLNSDNIYFAGKFRQSKDYVGYAGQFSYSILENKIIDGTFGFGELRTWSQSFTLFDDEERSLTPSWDLMILNLKTKLIEQQILYDTISIGDVAVGRMKYSQSTGYFIGGGSNLFSCIKNKVITNILTHEFDYIIYPNPTTSDITIERNCSELLQSYSISDIHGNMLSSQNNISPGYEAITISMSKYPANIYFIRYTCGSTVSVYKVIKQG